ncbi:two-partner secretion domain-containing protein [Magnetospirillum gryphiswaldense]|nr:filamentous hemagglutinin N-terminal domain-containing protein [Magnetospirillum gryphiswaldense]
MRRWLISTTALAGVLTIGAPAALANPQGGTVAQGSATITQTDPKTLTINQTSDRAVLNWQNFSIGAGETTRFIQPSSSSSVLNRVTGDQVSQILGSLQANGRVYLVNPNGIVFGAGSKIDVAALVASTANIKNENFMAGNMKFDIPGKANAQIVNEGTITAADGGLVAIVSPYLRNSGIISARLGKVALAAANGVTLDLYGDNLILFQASDKIASQIVGTDGKPVASLIENSGKIYADGGRVLMSANAAKGVVDNAINTTGLISARAVEQQGGEIVLKGEDAGIVQVSGSLDASGKEAGQKGGTVNVLGDVVALQSTAKVDVSGDAGGGTALIGGDYLGGGTVRNADVAYMAKGAVIDASAITTGNGGKSILWANNTTRSYGSIFARGGRLGGDGGFVETSGKVYLAQEGSVDASAPKGKAGTWLMDPGTVYIEDSVAESNTQSNGCVGCSGSYLYRAATNDPAYIQSSTINAALSAGNKVYITTTDTDQNADLYVNGNIVFTHGLGATSDVQLYLQAARNIYVTTGRIYEAGTKVNAADLNVYLQADIGSGDGVGSVYVGDQNRNVSTIDVGSEIKINAPTLVQIYKTNSDAAHTLKAHYAVTIQKYWDETNTENVILGNRSIYVADYDPEDANVAIRSNNITLSQQGDGVHEVALTGRLITSGITSTDIETSKITLPTLGGSKTTQQQTESSNVDSNNKERIALGYARNLMELGKNIDGADKAQLAHNVVALYLQSIDFTKTGSDFDSLGDRARAFDTIRSMVYDSLNGASVEGKGYNELMSLIMSGDIQPDMNNQLWRALMIGGELSPAQKYAIDNIELLRSSLSSLDIEENRPTISGSAKSISFQVASASITPDPAIVSMSKNSPNAAATLFSKMDISSFGRAIAGFLKGSAKSESQKNNIASKLQASNLITDAQKSILSSIKTKTLSEIIGLPDLRPINISYSGNMSSAISSKIDSYNRPLSLSTPANGKTVYSIYKPGTISYGEITDVATLKIGSNNISLASMSNGGKDASTFPGTNDYNSNEFRVVTPIGKNDVITGYQCTDMVRQYLQQLGLPKGSSQSVGNGGDSAAKIVSRTQNEPIISGNTSIQFRLGSPGTPNVSDLPQAGAVLSQSAAGTGHVSIVKSGQLSSDGKTYTLTLIENNALPNMGDVVDRQVVFTNKSGAWEVDSAMLPVINWANPVTKIN